MKIIGVSKIATRKIMQNSNDLKRWGGWGEEILN
jgi:hypothetical protein